MSADKEQDLIARANKVIPLSTQTLSKSASQWMEGVFPRFASRAKGARVWDANDNEWLDFAMALGPILLGYAEPSVDEAVRRQIDEGMVFTLGHPLEVIVSEQIVSMVPGAEAVRFGKTGSDSVSAAVRAARAVTGRDHIVTCGHHGWHDWFVGLTPLNRGVPGSVRELVSSFVYNDLNDLERELESKRGGVAAVVIEPSGAQLPAEGFLQGVVDLAHHYGALAVFDEVVTGFRIAPGGAQERYGVIPDLSCYGKALGNGMPVSAVAGRWEVMSIFEEIFYSLTHGGETLSLAAASTVLDIIADGAVLAEIEARGERLQHAFRSVALDHGVEDLVQIGGEPQRTVISFPGDSDQHRRSWVQQCFGQRKVLYNGSVVICARHTDSDVDIAVEAFDTAVRAIGEGRDLGSLLVGPPLLPAFRLR
jgi:glutamate-1-semialdehyde aminotransferase